MTEVTNNTSNELQVVIDQNGLEQETRIALKNAFDPFYRQASQWKERAEGLVVTSPDQIQEMSDAREARLALKEIRVNVEKKRKELKEDSLRKGKAIDAIAGVLKELIEPIEKHLQAQEDFIEIQETARKTDLKLQRHGELAALETNPDFYNLAEMSEEEYQQILDAAKYMANKRKEDARKAEEARLQAIEDQRKAAEAAEAERIRLAEENKKLRTQVKEVKSELKETKEVLKETEVKANIQEKTFEGFIQGSTSGFTKESKPSKEPKTGPASQVTTIDPDEAKDIEDLRKMISEIQAIWIPYFRTAKGKALSQAVRILLKKTSDYAEQHLKTPGKITI